MVTCWETRKREESGGAVSENFYCNLRNRSALVTAGRHVWRGKSVDEKQRRKCFQDDSLIVVVGETTRFQHNGTLSHFASFYVSIYVKIVL
jgi:hypothetical protein